MMQRPNINGERLWQRLQQLSAYGSDPRGGITRPGYSRDQAAAMALLADWMREAGLETGLDASGNLIGVYRGAVPGAAALGTGSHVDTVPRGGAFDGALGVLGALEAVQTLAEAGMRLRRPVAVIAFADEEGNNFGIGCLSSQLYTGAIPPEQYADIKDRDGRSLAQYIEGFSVPGVPRIERPDLAAFLELHIEQGPLLDHNGEPAAAVTDIVGISRTTVTFTGEANHAGTTPMHLRKDALQGAAEFALWLRETAEATDGQAVLTVGVFEVGPGATNVIPGEVRLRVEMRSPDNALMAKLRGDIERTAHAKAAKYGLTAELAAWHHVDAIPMDKTVVASVEAAMAAQGVPVKSMPSWAGHDSKIMARYMPTGMIFVPSKGGWSHSPLEDTSPEACAQGAALVYGTLLQLDERLAP